MKHTLALAAAAALTVVAAGACSSDDSISDHNDTDVAFAQDMIPHHAQAIQMSDILLATDGVDPEVADLAEEIKAAQQPEIDAMEGWLEGWGEDVPSTDPGDLGDMSMKGMASAADIADLEAASGNQAARLFLEEMTGHHEGAIEMARVEVEGGDYADAVDLAGQIIDTQQSEIVTMDQLLREL